MKLENKVIVITGSTRGIGRAIAEACAREGGKVVICSRNKEAVENVVNSLSREGFDATGIAADVSNNDLKMLFDHALNVYGSIDVWINNAGLSGGYRFLHDVSEDEIREIVNINVTATIQACRLVIPYFVKNEKGIIINMSGMGGRCEPAPYMAVYAATKAAVTSLTKSLAEEYKEYPLSIHSVIPGMVSTDFYKDLKVSPDLSEKVKTVPVALKVFGVPINKVAQKIVDICAQEPGKMSGRQYTVMSKSHIMRAVVTMMWYRITGKLS